MGEVEQPGDEYGNPVDGTGEPVPAGTEATNGAATDGGGGYVDVVGVAIPVDTAAPTVPRPHVVIATESWAENWGERLAATRLTAGALALRARVSIASLERRDDPARSNPRLRYDGVFPVHSFAASESADTDQRTDLLRAALVRQPGGVIPETAERGWLRRASRNSPEAAQAIAELAPDVVILAGPATFWLGEALPVGPHRPRVVVLPLCGADPVLSSQAFRPLAGMADAIGVFSDLEGALVAESLPPGGRSKVHRLEIALPVNRLAGTAGMAGVAEFGRYVLVISAFDEDPTRARSIPHDYLRLTAGDVAVAEVRHGSWVVTSARKRFDIPWPSSRMNVWRLMSRAALTLDLRPQGPLGREAVESLRFGTPVVVPEGSVAAEHAARANGGLWYRNTGEAIDAVRCLLDDEALRSDFGARGRAWAESHHGDIDAFVEAVSQVVLGPD